MLMSQSDLTSKMKSDFQSQVLETHLSICLCFFVDVGRGEFEEVKKGALSTDQVTMRHPVPAPRGGVFINNLH